MRVKHLLKLIPHDVAHDKTQGLLVIQNIWQLFYEYTYDDELSCIENNFYKSYVRKMLSYPREERRDLRCHENFRYFCTRITKFLSLILGVYNVFIHTMKLKEVYFCNAYGI